MWLYSHTLSRAGFYCRKQTRGVCLSGYKKSMPVADSSVGEGECKEPAPVAAPAPAPVASAGPSVTADAGGSVTKLDLSGTTCKLESKCLLIEPHYTSDLCCASQASLAPLEDAQV